MTEIGELGSVTGGVFVSWRGELGCLIGDVPGVKLNGLLMWLSNPPKLEERDDGLVLLIGDKGSISGVSGI